MDLKETNSTSSSNTLNTNKKEKGNRVKFHIRRRLGKAVRFAKQLYTLSQAACDEKTQLECKSYFLWMEGVFFLERKEWKNALSSFTIAKELFEKLSKFGDSIFQKICQEKISLIEPSIRFCNYHLSGTSTNKEKSESESLKNEKSKVEINIELFSEETQLKEGEIQLNSLLEQARIEQVNSLKEINFKGLQIPLKSEEIRTSILKIKQLSFQIEKQEKLVEKLSLYDSLFVAYDEAFETITSFFEKNTFKKKKEKENSNQSTISQKQKLILECLSFNRLNEMIERNLILINLAEKRIEGKKDEDTNNPLSISFIGQSSKPSDISKLYFNNLQLVEQIKSNLDPQKDEEDFKKYSFKILSFKTFQVFWLAVNFSLNKEWTNALAIFSFCQLLLSNTIQLLQDSISKEKDSSSSSTSFSTFSPFSFSSEKKNLNILAQRIRTEKCILRATFFVDNQKKEQLETKEEELETKKGKEQSISSLPLIQKLTIFDTLKKIDEKESFVTKIPPSQIPIPSKPVLFDLAFVSCQFPSLDEKKQKKKSSFWSSWWG